MTARNAGSSLLVLAGDSPVSAPSSAGRVATTGTWRTAGRRRRACSEWTAGGCWYGNPNEHVRAVATSWGTLRSNTVAWPAAKHRPAPAPLTTTIRGAGTATSAGWSHSCKCDTGATAEVTVTVGSAGDDTLSGTAGADVICGLAGDDRMWGDSGDDRLDGGNGTDYVNGGDGTDNCTGAETSAQCEQQRFWF